MKFGSDRPFRRSVIKIVASMALGKSKSHSHNAWPGLKLDVPRAAGASGAIHYQKRKMCMLLHPSELTTHEGDEINIVGSGPSIKDNDMAAVAAGSAILLNGAITLLNKEIERPLAVAVEDERFVWRHFPMMRDQIADGTICLLSVGVIRAICEIDASWLVHKKVILIDDIRKPYLGRRRNTADLERLDFVQLGDDGVSGFSHDPARGVCQGGSVAISALQFAVFCNPGRIGFFGLDISNAQAPRFYETPGETAKSGVARAEGRILSHVNLAKAICRSRGIELLNFSAISALCTCGLTYDARYAKNPQLP
jgi:hypothetical protein